MLDIQYIGKNIKISDKIQDYVQEKLSKHEKLLEKNTGITVLIKENKSNSGDTRNYKMEISSNMPHAFIRVEGRGSEISSIIDELEVLLKRRLKRYHDQFQKWQKEVPWRVREIEDTLNDVPDYEENISYKDYEPEIKVKEYSDDTPLHPAEAIEKMELIGHECFLFNNIETGKYSMIYKRSDGGYGLVQPKA
ncbi:ribosome-associated translation inhibitor RaiA [Candidatus Dojkabacteria bacterium]|uniref:Ribosome-associated translation inhibitor RaiA n=1 Tax=Candidatus Dojkabacteria bacterium TaxID=2099670 RepID=A0A955L5Z4_9BACT|nr:ribosome-associated translation inhibitor RaiA [Candidatus Dojkabacteria bacterium]